jgi:hypothetical protein
LDEKEYNGEDLKVRIISPTLSSRVITGQGPRVVSGLIIDELNKGPKGVYILEISWGQKVEYLKIMRN